eukprot:scaffold2358_cov115-Pinguiococcus_pyrenoidosus.AAC.1
MTPSLVQALPAGERERAAEAQPVVSTAWPVREDAGKVGTLMVSPVLRRRKVIPPSAAHVTPPPKNFRGVQEAGNLASVRD